MNEEDESVRERAREDVACASPDAEPELVIRRGPNGQVQVERRMGHRWSASAEALFLEHLEATCNVMASATAAGFSTTAVYARRRSYDAFRAAWASALDTGYARLEMALVCAATNLLEPVVVADGADASAAAPAPVGAMTAREALQVLRLHRFGARGGAPQRFDWRAKAVDPDAMRAEILRKLAVVEAYDRKMPRGKHRVAKQND